MNSQTLNLDHAEAPRTSTFDGQKTTNYWGGLTDSLPLGPWSSQISQPPRSPRYESELTRYLPSQPYQFLQGNDGLGIQQRSILSNSLSPQPTLQQQRPSPPSPSDSPSEIYGPDRFAAHQQPSSGFYHAFEPSRNPPIVHFNESQLAMFAAENAARMAGIKDELALAAGRVTPGVDDTPYIQYALQALVRGRESPSSQLFYPSGNSSSFSQQWQSSRQMYDEEMGEEPITQPNFAHVAPDRRSRHGGGLVDPAQLPPAPSSPPSKRQQQNQLEHQHRTSSQGRDLPDPVPQNAAQNIRHSILSQDPNMDVSNRWVPVTKDMLQSIDPRGRTYQPLTFKPRILRPFSMMILMILCLLMMAALVFTARFSHHHDGLTPYPGSIYSGQYFLFRILPQLIGAVIFIYAQSIVTTSLRVLPFAALANEDPRTRYLALFQKLYPASFLLPQFVGPWQFKVFDVVTWLTMFTIPLQSAAFTCIYVEKKWIWAPVQGVMWTLVAMYILLLIATSILMVFWFGQWTGLAWDVRSIGDLVPLLNRSNGMESYRRNDLAEGGDLFRSQLRDRWFDRLGYWRTEDMLTGGIWYAAGASGADQDSKMVDALLQKKPSSDPSIDSRDMARVSTFNEARGNYLPWCLRDANILASVAVTSLLLLALLVVSFIQQTRLEVGFLPKLPSKPDQSGFSAANFVFSFIPSLLGVVLFLAFQNVDHALRLVQPWGDLYKVDGSLARKSLLADYSACLPLHATWRAARNGHWRVAFLSLMSTVFVFIPILAGGLFMALTGTDTQVRMFPNMPVFGVLLALLFLYVGSLSLMVPHRRQFMLPRPVTSIAEIISFCSAEELTQDSAFRAVRSHGDLKDRLGVGRNDIRDESVWFFGIVPGRDEQRLSVRRMKRFTEKRTTRSMRSMV